MTEQAKPTHHWDWKDSDGPSRLVREFSEDGLSWFSFANSGDLAAKDPNRLLELLGLPGIDFYKVMNVTPTGRRERGFVESNEYGDYHIDLAPYLPAHVHILVCLHQAPTGGETLYLDMWKLAERIRKSGDRELFYALFSKPRITEGINTPFAGPTFSYRWQNLVCAVAPKFPPEDWVAGELDKWIHKEEPISVKLQPGDLVVMNNHRYCHARNSFEGHRHLIRLLLWQRTPNYSPPQEFLNLAKESAQSLAVRLQSESIWVKEKFGLSRDGSNPQARDYDFQWDRNRDSAPLYSTLERLRTTSSSEP